jgi:hypothetical protein
MKPSQIDYLVHQLHQMDAPLNFNREVILEAVDTITKLREYYVGREGLAELPENNNLPRIVYELRDAADIAADAVGERDIPFNVSATLLRWAGRLHTIADDMEKGNA